MKRILLSLILLAPFIPYLTADTIFQTTAQGKQVVIQRDAILVKDDPSFLVYKHFELKERRVEKVRLNKGSLPFYVKRSSPEEQKQIVEMWKRFGYTVDFTDQAGKTTRVFDAYLDFYPPGGRGSLLESVPPRTNIPVLLNDGGADEFEFSKIERMEIQGDRLSISLQGGQVAVGKFLMPTNQPAEVRFLGITDHYDPASEDVFDFSMPLERLKEIRFE
jgi:hypothetical protein